MGCTAGKRRVTVETINNITVPINYTSRQNLKPTKVIKINNESRQSFMANQRKKPLYEGNLKTILEVGSFLEFSVNVE